MRQINGSCHCGAVAFTATFEDEIATSKCNCSICTKTRFWKTILPEQAFNLKAGQGALQTYRFGLGAIAHHTCATCGVKVYGTVAMDDATFVAISVPCLDLSAKELAALPVTFEDGRQDAQDTKPDVTAHL